MTVVRGTTRRMRRTDSNEVVENPNIDEATAQELKAIEEGGMQARLKHIDRKHTEKGQVYYAETVEEEIPDQINWWSKFALCLVRHMDSSNKYVQKTSLQVNSQHLKDILRATIPDFPGISFQTKDISIDAPYRVLFHYRTELEAARAGVAGKDNEDQEGEEEEEEEEEEAVTHLDLLLQFIHEQFKDTIEESENQVEQGLISYQHLWTIMRPGITVYAAVYGQVRAFTLQNYAYQDGQYPGLRVNLEYVDFDGDDFGTRIQNLTIYAFAGTEKISALSAFPIRFHPDERGLRTKLIARGRRWEKHAGMHFRSYSGVALQEQSCGVSRYRVDGRVVVDTKTFHRLNANMAFAVNAFQSFAEKSRSQKRRKLMSGDLDEEREDGDEYVDDGMDGEAGEGGLELEPLTEEQCLRASATVRGFSFTEKQWLEFFIDQLAPAGWDANAFNQLVLPEAQKDLVQALVANHVRQQQQQNPSHQFDDIVKGKGKGLILVLHGPPGVGKTLTAETVAEFCQRPLYMVSSGDLGTTSETLDARLSRILDMASTWKAVLLIDEADVFLERRSLHDMERNGLVSIFLRVLEYYSGILFLTSNRVATFDDAFKSRIHVPLKYADLTFDARKQIWRNFLGKSVAAVDEAGYDSLARAEINGRQIKNVIRTAKSLAQFRGDQLDRAQLEQVIQIQREFEDELSSAKGANGQ